MQPTVEKLERILGRLIECAPKMTWTWQPPDCYTAMVGSTSVSVQRPPVVGAPQEILLRLDGGWGDVACVEQFNPPALEPLRVSLWHALEQERRKRADAAIARCLEELARL